MSMPRKRRVQEYLKLRCTNRNSANGIRPSFMAYYRDKWLVLRLHSSLSHHNLFTICI